MRKLRYILVPALFGILVLTSFTTNKRTTNTEGNLSFTFKTVTANDHYAPRHVLAVWIEDVNGFVKSRLVKANSRKQHLVTWNSQSSGNEVDAVTGATINSHQSHIIEWDCTDLNGNVVPDGTYTIWMEFTEKHAQGPLHSIEFEKGTSQQILAPTATDHFINMELNYTPNNVGIENIAAKAEPLLFPNPCRDEFNINLNGFTGASTSVRIYSLDGKLVYSKHSIIETGNFQIYPDLNAGTYFVKIENENQVHIEKLMIL